VFEEFKFTGFEQLLFLGNGLCQRAMAWRGDRQMGKLAVFVEGHTEAVFMDSS